MSGEENTGNHEPDTNTDHATDIACANDKNNLREKESAAAGQQGKPPSYHPPTRPIEWWQFGLNAVLAGIAVGALCVYRGQLGAMQGQLKEMQVQSSAASSAAQAANSAASTAQGQLSEMRHENRAWIAPTVGGGSEPQAPQEFKFSAGFGNSGREPATDVRYAIEAIRTAELDQRVKNSVHDYDTSCSNGREQMIELGAAYPSNGSIYMLNANFPRDLVEKYKTPTIIGCFLYTTQQETHHTTFCFYWSADKGPLSTWFFCPFGNNDAN
jgi:hypothetical protein